VACLVHLDADRLPPVPRFYQSGGSGSSSTSVTQQNLSKLFDKYRGRPSFAVISWWLIANADQPKDQPDRIGIDGAQKYLTDLRVGLDELTHLGVCELLQSTSIGEFTREKFISGWKSIEKIGTNQFYDNIKAQADHVKSMRKRLQTDRSYLKQVYRYTFTLARPEGQKNVPVDAALDFWKMFFDSERGGIEWNSDSTPWLDWWLDYYETKYKRPANKDLWHMVGELVTKTKEPGGESMDWWREDGAWPMAVDEFVSFVKEKKGDVVMDTS
jgi:DCN1-like protein 1/2